MDVREEHLFAWELDVMSDAEVADVPAWPGGADGLHHRLLGERRPSMRSIPALRESLTAAAHGVLDLPRGSVRPPNAPKRDMP
jgi:hypothetical protein